VIALAAWLESWRLSLWIKDSPSIWAYPSVAFVHTLGLTFSAGPSVAIDLRVLGFGGRVPLQPFDRLFRLIWTGFWIAAASGVVLLAADATTTLFNPVFYVKMALVLLAIGLAPAIRRCVFRTRDVDRAAPSWTGRSLAVLSLVCWTGAVTAGRFMVYFGPIPGT
jgi:hypothetical protein